MRKRRAVKRDVLPDPIYNSKLVTKLINTIMNDGKKGVAQRILYEAFDIIKEKTNQEPNEVFEKAMENIKPALEVKSRRVGGANYQVPVPVAEKRQLSLAMRWLLKAAREGRGGKDFSTSLYNQLNASFNKEGAAYKKKDEVHKMAEANKAFSHLTW